MGALSKRGAIYLRLAGLLSDVIGYQYRNNLCP
jgi:hypothetical protein